MTWHQAKQRGHSAAELISEALVLAGDDGNVPTETEKRDLARIVHLLVESVQLLQTHAGIAPTVRVEEAPDFSTRGRDALELTHRAIAVARNYRRGTESRSGAAMAAHSNGVEFLQRALEEFQRAGMEAVAS